MKRVRQEAGASPPGQRAKPKAKAQRAGACPRPAGRATARRAAAVAPRRVRTVLVVSDEMVDPAPCVNEPDPVCEAMTEVVAQLLNSIPVTTYRLATMIPLSREELRKLRRGQGLVSTKSVVAIGRACFFTTTELWAIAEDRARQRAAEKARVVVEKAPTRMG